MTRSREGKTVSHVVFPAVESKSVLSLFKSWYIFLFVNYKTVTQFILLVFLNWSQNHVAKEDVFHSSWKRSVWQVLPPLRQSNGKRSVWQVLPHLHQSNLKRSVWQASPPLRQSNGKRSVWQDLPHLPQSNLKRSVWQASPPLRQSNGKRSV